jgi:hypothetical protein
VPKLAATLASLLLIASSIGVNIARYPQVGRLADPGTAAAAEPENSPPPAIGRPASQTPPAGAESGTRVAEEWPPRPADHLPPAGFPTIQTAQPAPPVQPEVAVPIVDVRPMVPVANLAADRGNFATGANDFLRLPPVEFNGAAMRDLGSAQTLDASAYPSTSTP